MCCIFSLWENDRADERICEENAENPRKRKRLAEKTGINQADISKLERGNANPSLLTLQRLAEGMGMGLSLKFEAL